MPLHIESRFSCGNVCFYSSDFVISLINLNIFLANGNWPCHEYDNNLLGKKSYFVPKQGKKKKKKKGGVGVGEELADRNACNRLLPIHLFAVSKAALWKLPFPSNIVSFLSLLPSDKHTPGRLKVFDTLYEKIELQWTPLENFPLKHRWKARLIQCSLNLFAFWVKINIFFCMWLYILPFGYGYKQIYR